MFNISNSWTWRRDRMNNSTITVSDNDSNCSFLIFPSTVHGDLKPRRGGWRPFSRELRTRRWNLLWGSGQEFSDKGDGSGIDLSSRSLVLFKQQSVPSLPYVPHQSSKKGHLEFLLWVHNKVQKIFKTCCRNRGPKPTFLRYLPNLTSLASYFVFDARTSNVFTNECLEWQWLTNTCRGSLPLLNELHH